MCFSGSVFLDFVGLKQHEMLPVFRFGFFGSCFGAVDWLSGKVLSVLGVLIRSSVGSNCFP